MNTTRGRVGLLRAMVGNVISLQSIAFAVDGKRWSAVGGPGVALGTLTSAAPSTTATRAPILAAVPFRRLASRFCGRRREGIGIDSGTEIFSRGYSDWS
jgi:hypothetical protein